MQLLLPLFGTRSMIPPVTQSFHALHLRSALLSALVIAMASISFGAETKSLPIEFKAPLAKVEAIDAPQDSSVAWQTEHFLLISDDAIPRETLQRFATTIESVPKVMEALPLPLLAMLENRHPVIRLCRNEERFTQFGGPPSSVGYYQPRENRILIRADLFLNPQRSGSTRLKDPPEEDLLVHELSHLCMAGNLGSAPPWLSEGIAEYLSIAHQRGGHYLFNNSAQFIRSHLAKHLPSKDLQALELPSLQRILTLSHRDWAREISISDPADRYLPYATSLLFVHYLMEGGNDRRRQFDDYLTALKTPRSRRQATPVFTSVDPDEAETLLVKYWSTRGLKVRFDR